ncbi:aspartate transaminase [Propionibacterium ruminifibrarum]|uniref:Aspartate transaminase n=1 Tax=Propionibacterium ruminifibrarum TaxID=1962131 RepID=A0A375HXS7_9ACTN|nr:amino acid aminotransferase [Propionibacterium ruminifibrarum]SPF67304.1 aspartate transaminase [Propionibacterium ruminifibrarum]
MSIFAELEPAPYDPIFHLTDLFKQDNDPRKVNLGVGVYQDDNGKVPLLKSVEIVQKQMADDPDPWTYLPLKGWEPFNEAAQKLVFGADSEPVLSGRVATIQSLSGTGALLLGADFYHHQVNRDAGMIASDPTWSNHHSLFRYAGYQTGSYRYYDATSHGIDVEGMLADIRAAEPGTVVLLHACCHNPTGYDLSPDQWGPLIDVLADRRLMPFVDLAYEGFSRGLEEDAGMARAFAEAGLSFFVASSFSKNMAMYGGRTGAIHAVCADADEAFRVKNHLARTVRSLYSNAPFQGATIAATILNDPQLRATWEDEVTTMRERIARMRVLLLRALEAEGVDDMGFITRQAGMFSLSGLTRQEMIRLRKEFHVYGLDSGRLCMAALNTRNVEYVASAIAAVHKR